MSTNFHISATLNNTPAGRYAFSATIEGKEVIFYTNDSELYDYFDPHGERRFPVSEELRRELEEAHEAYEVAEEAYDEADDNEFEVAKAAYDKAYAAYETLRRELEEQEEEFNKYEAATSRVIRELLNQIA